MAPPCNNQKPISTSEKGTEGVIMKGREQEAGGVVTEPLYKPIPSELHGQCLEIFEVRVSYHGRKTSGKIHGLIYCNSSSSYPVIYKRNKRNAENVSFPGPITLASLPFAIGADDPFIISVKLWHGSDELCRGYTKCWHPFGWCMYDEVITHEVKGRNGAAIVTYAVITNAVIASVEVILVKGNRNAGARMYGTITASMSGWDAKRMLFCRKRDKYIDVDSGGPAPLSRSVLLIPYTSSLHIDVDLSDAFSYLNAPVAKGTANFSEKLYGCFEEIVSGKYGEIKVKVTWWSYYDHPDTYEVRRRYF